ncbi:MAG TPA: hypothetical protein VGQ83_29195 [Polyangia bacterium]
MPRSIQLAALGVLVCLAGAGCRSRPTAADAGHVELDLARGLPVMPGARVVYGGTLEDVFTMELATARPVAEVAAWYEAALPRVGWKIGARGEAAGPPARRFQARRGATWLHARIRAEAGETEVSFALGHGEAPAAGTVLPDEGGGAASAPASQPPARAADGGTADAAPPAAGTDVRAALAGLPLPDSVQRVGVPTDEGGVASTVVTAREDVARALAAVRRGWDLAGWSTEPTGDGVLPQSKRLRAVKGPLAATLTLMPGEGGATGTLTVGPRATPGRVAPAGRPAGRRSR